MPTAALVLYVISGVLEAISACFIVFQAIRSSKMVYKVLAVFSVLILPASVCNILSFVGYLSPHWNSFLYLFTTFFLLVMHFWLILDIGSHLRVLGIQWKHPLAFGAFIGLFGALVCLSVQIIVLLVKNNMYPLRKAFIVGVCLAILAHGLVYCYTFATLIDFRARKLNEGPARTTALGVWFLSIQFFWYALYGALYIWFFFMPWEKLSVLLAFDYFMRLLLCFMFAWPPPPCIIDIMADRFTSETLNDGSYNDDGNLATKSSFKPSKSKSSSNHHYIHLEEPPLQNTA
ncbi:unnamed protein product [Rhizopus stolonifer]